MAAVNSSDHTFLSNQILGGLPVDLDGAGTDNLGDPSLVDFEAIAGDQFFDVSLTGPAAPFSITSVEEIDGGTRLEITVTGLTDGADYILTESTDLGGFGAVTTPVTPGTSFTAAGAGQTLTIDLPAGDARFYRVEDAP
jgi:hypothetical protein